MALQFNVTLKKIFAKHRHDIIKFHYDDYVDAKRCFNRLIRRTVKESERYYISEIAINDRTSERLFKKIESTT